MASVRGVEPTYEGPTITCPNCATRIAVTAPTGWTVRSPADVYHHLGVDMGSLEREELRVVLLNTRNLVLRVVPVYVGNVSASLVKVGELFREAVRIGAPNLILVHSHPSGDPTPSPDDLHLTAEALAAGRLLDVQLLDHVVIASGGYVSLRDRGVAFDQSIRKSVPMGEHS
jgi:DNA repair protein RadC